DQVAPGLGRFVVELKPQTATTRPTPRFTAVLQPSRETTPGHGKWTILISMPDAVWNQPPGEAFHCCPLKVVETTPIRELTAGPPGPRLRSERRLAREGQRWKGHRERPLPRKRGVERALGDLRHRRTGPAEVHRQRHTRGLRGQSEGRKRAGSGADPARDPLGL